jgi:AmmeMemoRadiSam system protein B
VSVRPAAVAGLFYPADAGALRRQVQQLLDTAPCPPATQASSGTLKALVVPHAGYVYSGRVAALCFRLLQATAATPARVLLLGPAHYVPVDGLALSGDGAWTTPLGEVPLDVGARGELLGRAARLPVTVDDEAHQPEHSLEVQLPFLQVLLPDVPLLPVLVGRGAAADAAAALQPWWDDPDTLVVVSTDLSHYETEPEARRHDARTVQAVLAARPDGVASRDACGVHPLRVLLTWASHAGTSVRLLGAATSADAGGGKARVVGYGAFAVERAT